MDKYINTDVLAVCARVHGAFTGSGDGVDDEQLEKDIAYLEFKLDKWHPNKNFTWKPYEAAVQLLISAALDEARQMMERYESQAL